MTDIPRNRVVECARSWIGTPYHHMARVKGAGADCGTLIIESFVEAGAVEDMDLGFYTRDWHLHRSEEKYLGFVEHYLQLVEESETGIRDLSTPLLPGQVLVWRVGRTFSHGAIVTGPDSVVHASHPARLVEEIRLSGSSLMPRTVRLYDHKGYPK